MYDHGEQSDTGVVAPWPVAVKLSDTATRMDGMRSASLAVTRLNTQLLDGLKPVRTLCRSGRRVIKFSRQIEKQLNRNDDAGDGGDNGIDLLPMPK